MSTGESITCPGCGKRYAFKPEYAGRKLKCKCGTSIAVPAVMADADDAEACDVVDTSPPPAPARPQLSAARASPAPAPIPRAGVPTPGAAKRDKSDSGGAFGMKVFGGGIIGFIVLISVGFKLVRVIFFPPNRDRQTRTVVAPAPDEVVEAKPSQDAQAREMMRRDAMVDMSTWLNTPPSGKTLGVYTLREARDLYEKTWTKQLGVKKVYAPGRPGASSVIFLLPDDKAARKAVFDWQAKWHREQGLDATDDAGDKMLIISIPITKRSE